MASKQQPPDSAPRINKNHAARQTQQTDVLARINRASDAGSRQSYVTNQGLPKSLWQRGAIFSTRISRANISAGEGIPQYKGAHEVGGGIQAHAQMGATGFQQNYQQLA